MENIKQADKRLRRGQKELTMEWVEKNVGGLAKSVSMKGNENKDFDMCLYLIPFINMFDYVQRQLVKESVPL